MSDLQPVTLPTPPKVIYTGQWLFSEGLPVVQGAVSCQQNWHKVLAIKGMAGVHTTRVSSYSELRSQR
jgi:hypothetical protein